jgi:hypothetical protein
LSAVLFDLVTVVVFGFYFACDGPHFFRTLATGMSPHAQKVFLNVYEITTAKTGGTWSRRSCSPPCPLCSMASSSP